MELLIIIFKLFFSFFKSKVRDFHQLIDIKGFQIKSFSILQIIFENILLLFLNNFDV